MITSRSGKPEEVGALVDGAAEGDDDAWCDGAIGFLQVVAVARHIRIGHEIGDDVLLEGLLPSGVVAGACLIGADAEQLAAQAEERAVGVRVVDAEAALGDREVGIELGHGAGQAGVAEGADGRLRLVTAEIAERAGGDDVGNHLLPCGGAEQAGLVVVALGREVGVATGEVIQGAVLLQRLVAEGAEGQVLGAVAVDDPSRPLAERLTVGQ